MRYFVALLICFFSFSGLLKAELSRAPYVQLATDHSICIVWRTVEDGQAKAPVVRYGTSKDALKWSSKPENIQVRRTKKDGEGESGLTPPFLHSAPKGTYQFEATLTGLKPDTLYYYAVFDGEKRLTSDDETWHFRTHPKPGTQKDLYFWVVGDSGTGGSAQKQVYQAMRDFNKSHNLTLTMYLHVGDMAYGSGKDNQFQSNFFEVYQPTLRNTVCWPAMGNHEGYTSSGKKERGPYFDAYVCPKKGEAGGVASGTENYYSFDYGRVHFIALNSHDLDRKPTAAMAQWLKEDLAKTSTKKTDWLVAFWHHPPYTKGSHDSDRERHLIEMREMILPILESSGVDLVLTGHSHIYERSMLIDAAYDTPTTAENHVLDDGDGNAKAQGGDGSYQKSPGLNPNEGDVQVVAGHGGQQLHRRGYSPVMRKSIVEHGSMLIRVSKDTLSAVMLDKMGKVEDQFQIVKKQRVTPKRIAHPWKPSALHEGVFVIPKNAEWSYMADGHPSKKWTKPKFDVSKWKVGKAGFGYGDDDDQTVLDIKGKQSCVYIRKTFQLKNVADAKKLFLAIRYDDAFILHINGREALRKGVKSGRGADAKGVSNHEAGKEYQYFDLSPFAVLFKKGENVIAIEGHNSHLKSSDFTLDPALVLKKK